MSWPKASLNWILQLSRMWGQGHSYFRCSRGKCWGRKFPWAHTCCLKQQWIIKGTAVKLQLPVFPSSEEHRGSSCGCDCFIPVTTPSRSLPLGAAGSAVPGPTGPAPAPAQHRGHTRQLSYGASAALGQQLCLGLGGKQIHPKLLQPWTKPENPMVGWRQLPSPVVTGPVVCAGQEAAQENRSLASGIG